MKKIAWFTAICLATITVLLILWEFRTALVLFILSVIVSAVLRPIVDWLVAHGLARGLALLLTYLVIISVIGGLALVVGGPLFSELQVMTRELPDSFAQLKTQWLNGNPFQQAIANNFQDLNNPFLAVTGEQWNVQNFLGATLVSIDFLAKVVIVFVLSIYWGIDQERIKRLWLSLLPTEWRTHSRDAWLTIEYEIGAYLRSEIIQSLLTVLFLSIGYQLIGLKYPVLLAVIGAVGWLIVWFGGLIAVIPALLVGWFISPLIGLLAVVFTIGVLTFQQFIVEPKLFDHKRISSLLVIVMVLIMVKEYGLVGFFIAPPLAAAIQIISGQLLRHATVLKQPSPSTAKIDALKKRLFSIKLMISTRPEPAPMEINNLVSRLDKLIERADQLN